MEKTDAITKQEKLKSIIRKLHEGKTVDEVKKEFERYIRNVSPEEIASVENALIQEGLPVEEVQRLCDVHARVFDSALKRHRHSKKIPGHPVHTYIEENRALKSILSDLGLLIKKTLKKGQVDKAALAEKLESLKLVELHYARKENQLFPFLEKASFTGPSKVMWGKHNEIRAKLKELEKSIQDEQWPNIEKAYKILAQAMSTMIFLEERILFPTSMRKLTEEQWIEIKEGEPAIGYAWIKPGNLWDASLARKRLSERKKTGQAPRQVEGIGPGETGGIILDTGTLSGEQVNLLLKSLPLDVTFVDENDRVAYYSDNAERIFPRSPGVIGRAVQNCHPQKSLDVVKKIIDSFRKKERKAAEFWINHSGRIIYIRYFPLYDESGNYRGVIEVSQDITDIRGIEGERRLLEWK